MKLLTKLMSLAVILLMMASMFAIVGEAAVSSEPTSDEVLSELDHQISEQITADESSLPSSNVPADSLQPTTTPSPVPMLLGNLSLLNGSYVEEDIDLDGKIDFLTFTVFFNVSRASLYDFTFGLYYNGSSFVKDDLFTRYFMPGVQSYSVNFLYSDLIKFQNGYFQLKVSVYDETNNEWLHNNQVLVTTGTYIIDTDFESEVFWVNTTGIKEQFNDYDSDGRFEELRVYVPVVVGLGQTYDLTGYIYRGGSSVEYVDLNYVYLAEGSHNLTFSFDTTDLNKTSYTGDWTFRMSVTDIGYYYYYSTSQILYTFNSQYENEKFGYSYIGYIDGALAAKDTDGNGRADYLVATAHFNVERAQQYIITANIKNENYTFAYSYSYIDSQSSNTLSLPEGVSVVDFAFDTTLLRDNPDNQGPYYVEFWFSGNFLGYYNDTTAYAAQDFDEPSIAPTGVYSYQEVDTTSDGKYNYLLLSMELEVLETAVYFISANLYYTSYSSINSRTVEKFLTTGTHVIQLPFDGYRFASTNSNYTYELRFIDIDRSDEYDSNHLAYSYSDTVSLFSTNYVNASLYDGEYYGPVGSATFNGTWTYHTLDSDGDGLTNYLIVNGTIEVQRAGYFSLYTPVLYTNLTNSSYTAVYALAYFYQYFPVGSHSYLIAFSGKEINNTAYWGYSENGFFVGGFSLRTHNYGTYYSNQTFNSYVADAVVDGRMFYPSGDVGVESFDLYYTGLYEEQYSLELINKTGKIAYFKFGAQVDIIEAGLYSFEVSDQNSYYVNWYNSSAWLDDGLQWIYAYVKAGTMWTDRTNETFVVDKLELNNRFDSAGDNVLSQTAVSHPYTWPELAPTEAYFLDNNAISVELVDFEASLFPAMQTLYDQLVVSVPVVVDQTGYFKLSGTIRSVGDSYSLTSYNYSWLPVGVSYVDLVFKGVDIRSNLEAGPYEIYNLRLETRNLLQSLDSNSYELPGTTGLALENFEFGLKVSSVGYITHSQSQARVPSYLNDLTVVMVVNAPTSNWEGGSDHSLSLFSQDGLTHIETVKMGQKIPTSGNSLALWMFKFRGDLINQSGLDAPYMIKDWMISHNNELYEVSPVALVGDGSLTAGDFEPYVPKAKIEVEVFLDQEFVDSGDVVNFTIKLSNVGDADALQVNLTTYLEGPAVALINYVNVSYWSIIPAGGVEWAGGSISVLEFTEGYRAPVDFLFIFDLSGSMGQEINAVKDKVVDMLSLLSGSIPDFRVGIILHGWSVTAENPFEDIRNLNQLTSNMTVIIETIESGTATGGWEPWGDAAWLANHWAHWRSDSVKFVMLIGDEPADNGYVVGDGTSGTGDYNGSLLWDEAYLSRELGIRYISVLTAGYGALAENQFKLFAQITNGLTIYLSADATELPGLTQDFVINSMQEAPIQLVATVTYISANQVWWSSGSEPMIFGGSYPYVGQPTTAVQTNSLQVQVPVTDAQGVAWVQVEYQINPYDPNDPTGSGDSGVWLIANATGPSTNDVWTATIDTSNYTDYVAKFNIIASDINNNTIKVGDDATPFYAVYSIYDNDDPTIHQFVRIPTGMVYTENNTEVFIHASDPTTNVSTVLFYYSIDFGPWQSVELTLHNGTAQDGWFTTTLGNFEVGAEVRLYGVAIDAYGHRVKDDNGGIYYYFKVFAASGEDNVWPVISNVYNVPTTPYMNHTADIYATITDNVGVQNASLFYSTDLSSWTESVMSLVQGTNDTYMTTVPTGTQLVYYYVVAYDTSLNQKQGSYHSFNPTPDPNPPTVTITSPNNGTITNDGQVTVLWAGTDSESSIAYYELYVDDVLVYSGVGQSYDVSLTTTGPRNISVHGYDVAGNVGVDSIIVLYDLSDYPPSVTIISPTSGQNFVSTNNVSFIVEVTDDVGLTSVEARLDSGAWQAMTAGSGDQYTSDFVGLEVGNHTLSVRAIDTGLQPTLEAVEFDVSFNPVEDQAPVISITSPTTGQDFTETNNATLEAEVEDDFSLATVEARLDSGSWTAMTATTGNMFELEFANISTGQHTFFVRATDGEGQVTIANVSFMVSFDPYKPEVTIVSPDGGETITHSNNVTIVAQIMDDGALDSVMASLDQLTPVNMAENASGYYLVTFNALSNGQHTVTVTVVDDTGRQAVATVTFTVNYNPDVDLAPTVEILNPSDGDAVAVEFTVVAEVNEDKEGFTVEVRMDNGEWQTMSVDSGTGGYFFTFSDVEEGSHTVTVRVTDSAGQEATDIINVRVDSEASITSTSPGFEAVALFIAFVGLAYVWRRRD